uniref:Thymopoietin a n=1 Tax=Poecilia formosa TaxID=48698 RepID=A0A087XSP8_POEFO
MPEYLDDPSVLTKDKLKSELVAHNVELPSGNPTKDVYVQLYLKNLTVQNQKNAVAVVLDAFSSDEELPPVVAPNRRRSSGRKAARKSDKHHLDVASLTDESLRDELQKHGMKVGPIVDSTRELYQKKLQKFLDDSPAQLFPTEIQVNHNSNSEPEVYSDTEDGPKLIAVAVPEPVIEPELVPVVETQVRNRGKSPASSHNNSSSSSQNQANFDKWPLENVSFRPERHSYSTNVTILSPDARKNCQVVVLFCFRCEQKMICKRAETFASGNLTEQRQVLSARKRFEKAMNIYICFKELIDRKVGNERRGKTCSKGRQGQELNLRQLRRGLRPPYRAKVLSTSITSLENKDVKSCFQTEDKNFPIHFYLVCSSHRGSHEQSVMSTVTCITTDIFMSLKPSISHQTQKLLTAGKQRVCLQSAGVFSDLFPYIPQTKNACSDSGEDKRLFKMKKPPAEPESGTVQTAICYNQLFYSCQSKTKLMDMYQTMIFVEKITASDQMLKVEKDVLKELFPDINSPTGISASCRKPIRGAAGRPLISSDLWSDENSCPSPKTTKTSSYSYTGSHAVNRMSSLNPSTSFTSSSSSSSKLSVTAPSAGPTRAVRCSMTLWKKLALFAILATFVIFVYLAMETNSVSPFQASDSKSFASGTA